MDVKKFVKEEVADMLKYFGYAQGVFVVGLCTSPFIWIWWNWSFAWKTGLTCIVLFALTGFVYSVLKKALTDALVDKIKNEGKPERKKSAFQQKLKEIQNKKQP